MESSFEEECFLFCFLFIVAALLECREKRQGVNLQLMTNLGIAQGHGRSFFHKESGDLEMAAGERVMERSRAFAEGAAGIVDIGAAFQQQGHNI